LLNIPDHISRFRLRWQISPGSRRNMTRQILLTVLTRVEKSDRYGNETSAVGNRIVPAAAVTSSTCRLAGRGESHGRKSGGKMSLRHQSLPVNRTSPVRLRGRSYQPARDWPVELDARRLARPVRRRLVGVILHSRCTLPWFGRSIARRVIPTFYPIRLGRPGFRPPTGGDAGRPLMFNIKGRHVSKRVRLSKMSVIPSTGVRGP